MIRQCAWCRRVIGEVPPLQDDSVTHGLCPECFAGLLVVDENAKDRTVAPVADRLNLSMAFLDEPRPLGSGGRSGIPAP